jgi:uncharacterized protein YyaL (SSP411 family)
MNRLARETSPYLQQHAANPVDWYPWGDEALERARTEDKPILLSIGYSACHWCHVMAHESFEDPEVAAVMNRLFVNIKVDREERPDLDQIYQLAHQMMAERAGGWPLTVFLTPGQVPFYTGTYFPKQPRFGLPGFADLCERIAEAWNTQRADVERQNAAVLKAIGEHATQGVEPQGEPSPAWIDAAVHSLAASFDSRHGGFGSAPKFPHPAELELCLRRYAATGDEHARHMVLHTLRNMARGGIFDQLGGGFARYSVDGAWRIPHFEKMLYDNGPLLRLYADAWCTSPEPLFERIAEKTAGWIVREMQSPEGGYYSSLDADSEHEEGKFYVWDREEVRALLTGDEYEVVASHYALEEPPNFEDRHWHLNVGRPLEQVSVETGRPLEECAPLLASARDKLFEARSKRVPPGCDDKILTSWNALAIQGMARAGRVFGRASWIDSAERAFRFVRTSLWRDGRLLATYKNGRAHLDAYLDDHAYLLMAALELLQARFDEETLRFTLHLADTLLDDFEDDAKGGFFFTRHDHEALITRMKPLADNATPSGNGVAALALGRLGIIADQPRYAEAARRTLGFAAGAIEQAPAAHASLLMALEELLVPPRTIVLRGDVASLAEWQSRLAPLYNPGTLSFAVPPLAGLPPVLDKPSPDGGVNAWVCEGVTCLAPVHDFDSLLVLVSNGRQSG